MTLSKNFPSNIWILSVENLCVCLPQCAFQKSWFLRTLIENILHFLSEQCLSSVSRPIAFLKCWEILWQSLWKRSKNIAKLSKFAVETNLLFLPKPKRQKSRHIVPLGTWHCQLSLKFLSFIYDINQSICIFFNSL